MRSHRTICSRWTRWLALAVVGISLGGCHQTYDRWTGFNEYYPDFNFDYVNDLQPPIDPSHGPFVDPIGAD